MRAAAPSALSAGLARSATMSGGQQLPIKPPLMAETGFIMLASSWPSGVAHNLTLQAASWSLERPRKVNRVAGAGAGAGTPTLTAAAGPATPNAAPGGAAGIWDHAAGVRPAD